MRRRLFWLLALAGAVWLYLQRSARRPQPAGMSEPPDPAEELRRKLDLTKQQGPAEQVSYPTRPEPEPAEVLGVDQPVEPPAPVVSEDLDARRQDLHEQARSAADEMRRSSSD